MSLLSIEWGECCCIECRVPQWGHGSDFFGVFATVAAFKSRGGMVTAHYPLNSDFCLTELGFRPFHQGKAAQVVVIQTDHGE